MTLTNDCIEKSDEELAGLAAKDQAYFVYIINRYQEKLLRYIKRISNIRHEEAEDVLQDIFIKVYKNINDFDTDLKFSSWIYRIAHNQTISNFRKNQARPQISDSDINDFVFLNLKSDFNIIDDIDQEHLKNKIFKILNLMDEKYREVLVLKFFEEKDYKEISDILKKPMGTIASLMNRAKKIFKEKMKQENFAKH